MSPYTAGYPSVISQETRLVFGSGALGTVFFIMMQAVTALILYTGANTSFNDQSQFFTLQEALPLLTDGASVVFTVGIGATRGVVGGSVAAASRGALLAQVPSLALELAPRRIRVKRRQPRAHRHPHLVEDWHTTRGGGSNARLRKCTNPFGRLGTAREVAEPSRSSPPTAPPTSPARISSSPSAPVSPPD